MKYAVIFEPTGTGYSVYVPDLPGCVSVGKTLEQARKRIAEAIEFHIEGTIEDGDEPPVSESLAEMVEVPDIEIIRQNISAPISKSA